MPVMQPGSLSSILAGSANVATTDVENTNIALSICSIQWKLKYAILVVA